MIRTNNSARNPIKHSKQLIEVHAQWTKWFCGKDKPRKWNAYQYSKGCVEESNKNKKGKWRVGVAIRWVISFTAFPYLRGTSVLVFVCELLMRSVWTVVHALYWTKAMFSFLLNKTFYSLKKTSKKGWVQLKQNMEIDE